MLMEVKSQIKVMFLSIKYNIMKQMTNKVTFITNILFMILNNASFILQWIILFNIKDEIGGYTFKEVILLWGMAASTFGLSHIMFYKAFHMSDLIINGKLDMFLVQPKNVLINIITSDTSVSAIGDLLYGYICLAIYGITFKNIILFSLFTITGAIVITAFVCICSSTSFWITKGEILADSLSSLVIHIATYPGGIFKDTIKVLLYTIIPVGVSSYLGVDLILAFNIKGFIYIMVFTIIITILAFLVFNKGLKKYSSSNLMNSRI